MIDVVCALIFKGNRILATQHGKKSEHPYKWEFPGGKVKINESQEDAIIREINEELGMKIQILSKLSPVEFDYGNRQIKLIPFICRIEKGIPVLNEHIGLGWFRIAELSDLDLTEADKVLVEKNKNFI